MTETRTIPRKFPRENVVQRAIPWCTTHDSSMFLKRRCQYNLGSKKSCVISTGGPDHKWWKDT